MFGRKSKAQRCLEDFTRILEQHAREQIECHKMFVKLQNSGEAKE